jgi:hypothetical protein
MPIKNALPETIKYQIPVNHNQLSDNQLQSIDTDILRNVRVNKVFSSIDELNFYQMYNLLKPFRNMEINFEYNPECIKQKTVIKSSERIIELNTGAINTIDLELFYRLKLELISALNHLIIKNRYYLPYHKYQFFKIINNNLISYEKVNSVGNVFKYIFTLTIAREYKFQHFVIYYDIDLFDISVGDTMPNASSSIKNKKYMMKINKIELIGIRIPKTIEFHENRKTENENNGKQDINNLNIYDTIASAIKKDNDNTEMENIFTNQVKDNKEFDVMPSGNSKFGNDLKYIDILERSDIDKTLFDSDSQNAFIHDKTMNIAKDQQFRNHRCYGLVNGANKELTEYNDNPLFCTSYHPEVSQNGIWDAPCQINSDCPFYKANKNYPNSFGKCDKMTGKCEMPIGVIPIGFTKYGKLEPKCYNCDTIDIGNTDANKNTENDNRCCKMQYDAIKNNSVGYITPDYIFPNDGIYRKQYENVLNKQGLYANPSI